MKMKKTCNFKKLIYKRKMIHFLLPKKIFIKGWLQLEIQSSQNTYNTFKCRHKGIQNKIQIIKKIAKINNNKIYH